MSRKNYKYHYFYKITNNINNHFYYGVHNTNNLNDGYMGSGKRLQYAYKKYGIKNFTKEILKFFDTTEEAFIYESEIVTEDLVKNNDCYNSKLGGDYSWKTTKNTISVKDSSGNYFSIHKDDERLGKTLHGVTKNHVVVKDKNGNNFYVECNDERIKTGELIHCGIGFIHAKDKNGNFYYVAKDDPRWISGELVGCTKGNRYSEESKQRIKDALKTKHAPHKTCYVCNEFEILKINIAEKDNFLQRGYQQGRKYHKILQTKISEAHKKLNYQAGEKNSHFGYCWIHNDKVSKSIKKEDLEKYLNEGWIKGRKMKF